MTKMISIEVAYALPSEQLILKVEVTEGTRLQEAILQSGILKRFPQIDKNHIVAGIFGKKVKLDTLLREKDRIEIYRPLIADPKEVRKRRAAAGKAMKKGKTNKK